MKHQAKAQEIRRRTLLQAAAMSASLAVPGVYAQSKGYPDKMVRIVVPSAPGGSLDLMARMMAQKLGERWNQTVVVENRPGANFAVGTSYVAKSAPDGYTLLYCHDGVMAKNPALYPNLSYNPLTELTPVICVVELYTLLYVRSNLPHDNLDSFLRALRAQPNKLNHAVGGPSGSFISGLFKSLAGVEYIDVPYKGAGPSMVALATGECDFTFADPGSAASILSSGRIRPLAVGSPKRLRLFPNLPALAEAVPEFDLSSWSGLIAPANTPDAVIRKINADVRVILAAESVKAQVEMLGLEVNPSSPEELATRIRNDIRKWSKLVKERNLVAS